MCGVPVFLDGLHLLRPGHLQYLADSVVFCRSNIVDVNSYNELKEAISQGKWARGPWSARQEF